MGDLNISFLESNEFIRHVRSSPLTKICSRDDTGSGVGQGCFWKICPSKESIRPLLFRFHGRGRECITFVWKLEEGQTDRRSSLKVTGVAYITLDNCKSSFRFLVLAAGLQSCLSLIIIIKWIFLGIHIYRVPPLSELSSLLLCYK